MPYLEYILQVIAEFENFGGAWVLQMLADFWLHFHECPL